MDEVSSDYYQKRKKRITLSMDKFDKGVSLLCWAYNEELLINEYLDRASRLMDFVCDDYEIILIDDGSTDRTYEIARAFKEKNPRLKIFRNEKNLNVGISCRRAIKNATKEFLFWQTVDWGYDISNLRAYLEYLKKYDIVQGTRIKQVKVKIRFMAPIVSALRLFGIKHLTRRSDTISKAIISVINYTLIRLLFRVPISDFQNVTFYPTKWIQSINFESRSSFVNPEGLLKSYWNGMTIKEVRIDFIPRAKGKGKGTTLNLIINSVKDICKLWFKWVLIGNKNSANRGKICKINA